MNFMIFGDSHSIYFNSNQKILSHKDYPKGMNIKNHVIHGSTILGLGRRESTLSVAKKIENTIKPSTSLVFGFGQVDLELGYYYRKVIKKELINHAAWVEKLIAVYFSFLDNLNKKNNEVIIKGVNLPVLKDKKFTVNYVKRIITENIKDENLIKHYFQKLNETMDEYATRVDAANELNILLAASAANRGWGYFDINDNISGGDPWEGVKDTYIPSGEDHHLLDSIEIRLLHINKLKEEYEKIQTTPFT